MISKKNRQRFLYAFRGFLCISVLNGGVISGISGQNLPDQIQIRGIEDTGTANFTTLSEKTPTLFISNPMEIENKEKLQEGARIQPLPVSEMQEDWVKILQRLPGAGLKGAFSPVYVFGTLMHNPQTMGSFLDYWVTSKLKMGLSGREQELVILRMGFHYNCNYVWKHHVPVAREYGVGDAELEAVKTQSLPSLFSPRETALLMLTDEMVQHRTVRDEAWTQYGNVLKPSEVIDLISLVSQYVFFSLLNNSIRIEVEEPLKNIEGLK
jgi:4-carboxymuconolactone decarboxylase